MSSIEAEKREQIRKDATGESEEEEERVIQTDGKPKKGGKKSEKPVVDFDVIKPGDFERHSKWKPEPFPEGQNFATMYADIRAKHAEACKTEMRGVLEKHVSEGLWPTGKVSVVCRAASALRETATRERDDLAKLQAESAESAAERAEEKKKQVESLKGAMAVVCMGELMKKENLDKTMEERIDLGVQQAKRVFGEWATKINAWKPAARKKAIEAAQSQGIEEDDAEAILTKAAEEAASPTVDSPSKPKRKPDVDATGEEDEEAEKLVTPEKPATGSEASSPSCPTQSNAHKKAKRALAAPEESPTAVETVAMES